jgi:hypothetical protein
MVTALCPHGPIGLSENNVNPILPSPCDMARMLNLIRLGHQCEVVWNANRADNFKTRSGL